MSFKKCLCLFVLAAFFVGPMVAGRGMKDATPSYLADGVSPPPPPMPIPHTVAA